MKKKALLASILTIAMCFSIIAGATFALFTSESGVDVSVTAGNVDVVATINEGSLKTYSLDVEQKPGYFANRGTATLTSTLLTLTNVTPGDRADFTIDMTNNSNVDIQYRVKWAVDGELYSMLNATADGKAIANNVSGWSEWLYDAEDVRSIDVSVELPYTVGNEAENKAAEIKFVVEAVQANAIVNDVATADQLKVALEMGIDYISLIDHITLDDGDKIIIPEGLTTTIDLGAYELNGGYQTGSTTKHVYTIENHGNLTLQGDGVVNGRGVGNYGTLTVNGGTYNAIDTNGGGAIWAYDGSTTTVNDGMFNTTYYTTSPSATTFNVAKGATAVINGGNFNGYAEETVAVINNGDLTINGGNFTANHSVISSNNTLVINDANVTAYSDKTGHYAGYNVYVTGGETTINGGNYVINDPRASAAGYCSISAAKGSVTVYGGNFSSETAAFTYKAHNVTVYGGTFAGKTTTVYGGGTLQDKCGEYRTAYDNSDGTYTVRVTDGVNFVKNDAELAAMVNKLRNDSSYWNTDIVIVLAPGTYTGDYTVWQEPTWQYRTDGINLGSYANTTRVSFEAQGDVYYDGTFTIYGNGDGQGSDPSNDGYNIYTTFKGITFTNTDGDAYAVHMGYGADEVNFVDCHFDGPAYIQASMGRHRAGSYDLSLTGCTFADGKVPCISGYFEDLVVNGCTGNGGLNGFVNAQKGGYTTVTIKNSNITVTGKYFIRTNAEKNVVINNLTSNTELPIVWFRGANCSATITGSNLKSTMCVSTDANNTLTVDGVATPFANMTKAGFAVEGNTLYVWDDDGLNALYAYICNGNNANFSYGAEVLNGKTIKLLGDINAKKVTWNTINMQTGLPVNDGFTFDGNGYTISNLTINGSGMFYGNLNNGNAAPTVFKNLTFDNVTVNGDWHTGVLWSQAYGEMIIDNVHIINSYITGECNVGGFVGRNGDDGDGEITFNNCSIKNSTIISKGNVSYSDPNGAGAFIGSALRTSATLVLTFTGNNVSENVTMQSGAHQVGGGIYNIWDWSTGEPTVDTVYGFTNHDNR